jgi:regulator of cell morphogenesis and NO signaling
MSKPLQLSTLGEIVANDYRAGAVFDRFNLDFCCGGKRTLEEACRAQRISAGDVVAALQGLVASVPGTDKPDSTWRPQELTHHIVRRHHSFVRAQLPVIAGHIAKIAMTHGQAHPELRHVEAHFSALSQELRAHMMKEEVILFPSIQALSTMVEKGAAAPPSVFGSIRNPIRKMEAEHQCAGDELARIRELTDHYRVPPDACATYRTAFEELAAFDEDLKLHIHLENNVLFPQAIALELAALESVGQSV